MSQQQQTTFPEGSSLGKNIVATIGGKNVGIRASLSIGSRGSAQVVLAAQAPGLATEDKETLLNALIETLTSGLKVVETEE